MNLENLYQYIKSILSVYISKSAFHFVTHFLLNHKYNFFKI